MNGWDAHQLKLAFSLAICFLGLTAAFMGKFVQRKGPKTGGLLSALFFAAGLAGAGWATTMQSLPLFYLFYGVISGIGLGFGYVTPVAAVVKWFPEKPGFASGMVIMSFAAGSILASQIITPLVHHFHVANSFYLLAVVYGLLMLAASLYIANPSQQSTHHTKIKSNFTIGKLLTDTRFYGLWLMLFLNTTCGIALIAVAAPMAKTSIHISEASAILFVGLIGLFNGLGRLIWSSVSDKIGRWHTYFSFFIIGAVCFAILANTTNPLFFQLLIFIIISCYGGAFATMAPFIKDIYGADDLSFVFGYVLTAWAAAAFAGPSIISASNDYQFIFYIFTAVLSVAALIALILKQQLKPTQQ